MVAIDDRDLGTGVDWVEFGEFVMDCGQNDHVWEGGIVVGVIADFLFGEHLVLEPVESLADGAEVLHFDGLVDEG